MADWRKLALEALLADGVIDDTEIRVLRKNLWADGRIDKQEVEFLIDLRNTAQKKAKGKALGAAFEKLFFKAIESKVLDNGVISAGEARWLRTMLFADRKIDANEKKFLRRLHKNARRMAPEFEDLYEDCVGK
jgi:hypothetical protein